MDEWKKNDLIAQINAVIHDAIVHGGDYGGPYFCEPTPLAESVGKLAETLGCRWEWAENEELKKRMDPETYEKLFGDDTDYIRLIV